MDIQWVAINICVTLSCHKYVDESYTHINIRYHNCENGVVTRLRFGKNHLIRHETENVA